MGVEEANRESSQYTHYKNLDYTTGCVSVHLGIVQITPTDGHHKVSTNFQCEILNAH